VISINAADWTELENVLFSEGVPGHSLASSCDLTVLDWLWVRFNPDGSEVTDWGADVSTLLQPDPPTAWAMAENLAAVNGPTNVPAGQTTMATLSLTIAAAPGRYHLAFGDGYFVDETGASMAMLAGGSLEVVVQGP
jgi:hypothetical protein